MPDRLPLVIFLVIFFPPHFVQGAPHFAITNLTENPHQSPQSVWESIAITHLCASKTQSRPDQSMPWLCANLSPVEFSLTDFPPVDFKVGLLNHRFPTHIIQGRPDGLFHHLPHSLVHVCWALQCSTRFLKKHLPKRRHCHQFMSRKFGNLSIGGGAAETETGAEAGSGGAWRLSGEGDDVFKSMGAQCTVCMQAR
jgi:hypothetical protein